MGKQQRETPTVKKIVESMGTLAGDDAFHHLLDTYPEVIHALINTPETTIFLKTWLDYGRSAQGAQRNWAERYGKASGLAPQGILAMHALRAGLGGQEWETFEANLRLALDARKMPNGRWLRNAVPPPFTAEKNAS